jgi:hypothetical protein
MIASGFPHRADHGLRLRLRLIRPDMMRPRMKHAWRCVVAVLAATTGLALVMSPAAKAQCPPLPFQLVNSQVADATQVMADFDAASGCITSKGTAVSGTAGQVGFYAATGSTISGQSLSNVLDSIIGSAQGAIVYRGATAWTALGPGAIGYVLKSGGPSGDPAWGPTGGGGGGISAIVGAGIQSGGATAALPAVPLIVRPNLGSLTWLNQSGATAADHANGPLVLRTVQNTGFVNLNALIKTVAGPDWTVTIQYALGNHWGASGQDVPGLTIYNSANGRLYTCGLRSSSAITVHAWNSVSSWNSMPGSKTILPDYDSIWTRAQYVGGTNTLTFLYSIDGFTWETIYSTSAPFTGVPTHYGIAVGSANNPTGYVLSLNYMTESSP